VHNGTPTDFWVGNNNYASKVTIDGVTSDSMFGINTYNNVTGQGTLNGETIIGIATAVNRTWVIDGTGTYNAVFSWNNAEGPSVGGLAVLSNYQVWHWVAAGNSPAIPFGVNMSTTNVMPMSSTGTFSIAAPGTNYDYPTSFKGLNDDNGAFTGFSYPSMVIDVPMSQGELGYSGMETRLAGTLLGNPLYVFIPVTGTDAGSLYANETFTIFGNLIYGQNGVYEVNPDIDEEYLFEGGNEDGRPNLEVENEMDNFFVDLAEINLKLDKHQSFKSNVDLMLDELLA
jgi:hypothetical protein